MTNISGYSSAYQRDELIQDYKDDLALKSRLNQTFFNANQQTYRNKKLNITPVEKTRSAAEEIADMVLQNERAMANLKKVLKINDAGNVLDGLKNSNDLVLFNRFFTAFEKDIGGQKNITPEVFLQLWNRYKEKLAVSGTTGIFIPGQSADMDRLVQKIDDLAIDVGLSAFAKDILSLIELTDFSDRSDIAQGIYRILNIKKEIDEMVENKEEFDKLRFDNLNNDWNLNTDKLIDGLINERNKIMEIESATYGDVKRLDELNKYIDNINKLKENEKILSDLFMDYSMGMITDDEYYELRSKLKPYKYEITSKKINYDIEKKNLDLFLKNHNITEDEYKELLGELDESYEHKIKKEKHLKIEKLVDINRKLDEGLITLDEYNQKIKQRAKLLELPSSEKLKQYKAQPLEEVKKIRKEYRKSLRKPPTIKPPPPPRRKPLPLGISQLTPSLPGRSADLSDILVKPPPLPPLGSKPPPPLPLGSKPLSPNTQQLNNVKRDVELLLALRDEDFVTLIQELRQGGAPNQYKTVAGLSSFNADNFINNNIAASNFDRTNAIKYYIWGKYRYLYKFPEGGFGLKYRNTRGRGLNDKLVPFGKYMIHIPSLDKGFLAIKYPSKIQIDYLPKTAISSCMIKIINDILDDNKFSENDYSELEDYEKELFDNLITFSRLNRAEGLNLNKHKKITDKTRDNDIKRFNILKGEVVAGNNNPDIIRELKALLIKLHSNKIINKPDYNKIMEYLALI